jgi:transcriptional regulator with XRE-family HTH domain
MRMSYQLKIDKRSLKAAKFISKLQGMIQQALIETNMTQQEVAKKLGVDRSVVNRRLKSKSNLTARSISDFAYALDRDIKVEFIDLAQPESSNWIFTAVTSNETLQQKLPLGNVSVIPTTSAKAINPKGFERLEA